MPNTIPTPEFISASDFLEKDLYTYANYEEITKSATERGETMEKDKNFYALRILGCIAVIRGELTKNCTFSTEELESLEEFAKELKGKTPEFIEILVSDLVMQQIDSQ